MTPVGTGPECAFTPAGSSSSRWSPVRTATVCASTEAGSSSSRGSPAATASTGHSGRNRTPLHPLPERAELEPLTPAHHHGAAAALADAFTEDPGWLSVGPRNPARRSKFIYRTCLSTLRVVQRWAGPSWCITENGEPTGVLAGCAPGLWPPPTTRSLF